MATVLVVDDDSKTADMLRRTLIYEGYRVLKAANGVEALSLIRDFRPDLIVLDWGIPMLDGISVIERIRRNDHMPVLMLTGRTALEDKVKALQSGADDYLVKPFAPEELIARVHALLRRSTAYFLGGTVEYADLKLDPKAREVRRGERLIALSPREYDLLSYFLRQPCQVLKREQILQDVWGYDFGGDSSVLDVYVGYLRTKLEAGGEPRLIHTMRYVGYVLKESKDVKESKESIPAP